MTPYIDFFYFGLVFYVISPTVLSGLAGRRLRLAKFWIVAVTAIMLVIQIWTPQTLWPHTAVIGLWLVVGYGLVQWGIASVFLTVRQHGKSRRYEYTALGLALAPLALTKFVPLFNPHDALGFLGVSYLTFRSLDVIFNIQDGLITSLPITQYLAFLLFFPTISAGPIDRYRRFALDWNRNRTRAEFFQDLDEAVQRIFRGFLYKFILAALIRRYWLDPTAHESNLLPILSYMYAYSFYLFFDFAGYSAFAIGFSYLLGVHTPENFRQPFLAAQYSRFLGSLAHQPVVVVPRPCLYALCSGGDQGTLVQEQICGFLSGFLPVYGVDGAMARRRLALHHLRSLSWRVVDRPQCI